MGIKVPEWRRLCVAGVISVASRRVAWADSHRRATAGGLWQAQTIGPIAPIGLRPKMDLRPC